MMAKRTVRIPIWAICACVHCTQWQWQRRWRHYRPTNKNHSTFEIIAQNKSERTTERPRAISIAWYNNTYSNCLLRIRRMMEAIQRALMAVVFLLEFAARFSIHVLTSNLRYIRGCIMLALLQYQPKFCIFKWQTASECSTTYINICVLFRWYIAVRTERHRIVPMCN